MRWPVIVGVLAGLGFGTEAALAAQRPAPREPSERFSVLVYTSPADAHEEEGSADAKVSMAKVADEVSKQIKKRKKWFLLTENPDEAEIRVELVRHTLDEQLHTRMETRVDVTGTRKEWVDVQWVQEQHFLEARVELPGGGQVLVEGSDTRRKGGTLGHAAEELATNLETLVRERYWELEAAR